MSYNPFDIGKQISDNFAPVIRRQADRSILDKALSQINNIEDPQQYNNAMTQILTRVSPENQKGALEFLQKKKEGDLLNKIGNRNSVNPNESVEKNLNYNSNPMQEEGEVPNKTNQIPNSENPFINLSPSERLELRKTNKDLSDIVEKEFEKYEKKELAQNKLMQQKDLALIKMNEPLINETYDKLDSLETSASDYERLNEIFTNDADEMPSKWSAAFFNPEGNGKLSKIGYAKLSAPAQEAVKLITQQLRNAKDTFGARVTNFDAVTYLKGFPSLLNSKEGRERVLKDLRVVNRINQLHNKGILEAFEEAGGSDKITFSQARQIASKKYAKEIADLRSYYVNPNKKEFKSLPDPYIFKGKSIIDDETGTKLESNGKEWIPIE